MACSRSVLSSSSFPSSCQRMLSKPGPAVSAILVRGPSAVTLNHQRRRAALLNRGGCFPKIYSSPEPRTQLSPFVPAVMLPRI
ncbi:hypothetical protein E2562_011250 [Oryza meyeriana var. granulata]|uniref:Uncharacterized protein n=1 Tax=Oryza meyeriana var. granulata TaxID=110450 RepID=A0A6G1BV41_9ORYZ|nr:hypothetical protein E2562_011250 [Oryza meyeriana var. granulata]